VQDLTPSRAIRQACELLAARREADAGCMMAKGQGRNRVQLWAPNDATLRAHQSEHRWATRLQQALDEDRFELDLQRVLPAAQWACAAAPIASTARNSLLQQVFVETLKEAIISDPAWNGG